MELYYENPQTGRRTEITVRRESTHFLVTVNGKPYVVYGAMIDRDRGEFSITYRNKPSRCFGAIGGEMRYLFKDGRDFVLRKVEHATAPVNELKASLAAPMPGKIVKILVSEGDKVKKGDRIMVVEAMKMEHAIIAPYDGTVKTICFDEGDQVTQGVELAECEPEDSDET